MYIWTVKDNEYNLKLTVMRTVTLEKKLGCNPLMIFGKDFGGIPEVTKMVTVLHAALQEYNHGFTEEKTMQLVDDWLEEGHTFVELIDVLLGLFQASGFISSDEGEEAEKNA